MGEARKKWLILRLGGQGILISKSFDIINHL